MIDAARSRERSPLERIQRTARHYQRGFREGGIPTGSEMRGLAEEIVSLAELPHEQRVEAVLLLVRTHVDIIKDIREGFRAASIGSGNGRWTGR